MKKTYVLYTSVLLVCFFLVACGSAPAPSSEGVEDTLEPSAIAAFKLFHPTRGIGAHPKNDRYFNANGSTHKFYLPKGTKNNVARVHARMEAYQMSGRFGASNKWKGFQADYNMSGKLPEPITISQLFAVEANGSAVGPQVRIEIRSNGDLRAAFGNGNPATLAKRGQYNPKNFNVRVMSNGKVANVYLNGKRKVSSRRLRYQNKTNLFRWGLYYNTVTPSGIRSTMKNIRFYGLYN